jgi:ABC-type Fe3+-siderophore transport system permease subunit
MAVVALALIFVAALGIGRTAISPKAVLEILGQSLFGIPASYTGAEQTIVVLVRLPRVFMLNGG